MEHTIIGTINFEVKVNPQYVGKVIEDRSEIEALKQKIESLKDDKRRMIGHFKFVRQSIPYGNVHFDSIKNLVDEMEETLNE
jgi:hypothetical protein